MTELKRIIAVSKTVKIQHEYNFGNKYEGTDIWSSESEEVPADLPPAEVEEVRLMLRERVNADLERQRAEVIQSLFEKRFPKDVPPGSSAAVKRVLEAPARPQASVGGAPKTFRKVPANSVPAKPKEVVPDTPDGQPFA